MRARASRFRLVALSALIALSALVACTHRAPSAAPSGPDASEVAAEALATLGRAEDMREPSAVRADWATSPEVAVRRRAARALARMRIEGAREPLVARLGDEDGEVVAWAAYGVGSLCHTSEEGLARRLLARALTFEPALAPSDGALRPEVALARAYARCAAADGERTLVELAKGDGRWSAAVATALGDVATRRKELSSEAVSWLVDALAQRPPLREALFPLSRARVPAAFEGRVVDRVRESLAAPDARRQMAIVALARAGREVVAPDLARLVDDRDGASVAERAEAARLLTTAAGAAGRAEARRVLEAKIGDVDAMARDIAGGEHAVLRALVDGLSDDAGAPDRAVLAKVAALGPKLPDGARARGSALTCRAAGAAYSDPDEPALRRCGPEGSSLIASARLAALVGRPLVGARKRAFLELAASAPLRVREAALEAAGAHAELGDSAAASFATALRASDAGLVAVAATVIAAHPERVKTLAEREKRAALDPSGGPPLGAPEQDVAPAVVDAMAAALERAWPEDRVETRSALLDAAAALRHPKAEAHVQRELCSANAALRERAGKAAKLLALPATCASTAPVTPAPELSAPPPPTKLTLTTDAGHTLVVDLDPALAPVTVARLRALARAGFYRGVLVHRVVPGFVAQLGDPAGDGYGGSGALLRCETSPVPFRRFDVGMALAGRDTGSSQFFVTLSERPHLDGEYAWIGRASGDWEKVAEGDRVDAVAVTP